MPSGRYDFDDDGPSRPGRMFDFRNPKVLIDSIRENSITFGQIVEKALKERRTHQEIWTLLSDYVRESTRGGELPPEFLLALSAYTSYFSQKQA